MNKMDKSSVVKQQYSTAGNLENRIFLHEKYSINKFGWFNWLFSNYDIKPGDRILELGCGNGRLWAEHYLDLPEGVRLIMSDFSDNMLETAKKCVQHENEISYAIIDAQNILLPDESVDIVIANMMLYHVPDIDKALVETHRVLKKGGRFYCATLGENGIGSYIRNALGLPKENLCKFTLQNGAEYLKKLFNTVEKKIYDDALAVTDINDLIAYIHTLPWAEKLRSIPEKEMIDVLEERRENGVIFIPKEYGMFSSRIKK